MTITLDPRITAGLLGKDENPSLAVLDAWENEFFQALSELLEIQSRSTVQPVVVFPDGPATLH